MYGFQTTVVCGFPGVGKSYLYNNQKRLGIFVTDSDSSLFSHMMKDGEKVKDPNFPQNYIQYIKSLMEDSVIDLIFVSTHNDVRNALAASGIPYTIVYPSLSLKDVYMQRYKDRGSPESFINLMDEKFESFVHDCESDEGAKEKIEFLNREQNLYSYIDLHK